MPTITGNLNDIVGANMGRRTLTFRPLSTPIVDAGNLWHGEDYPVTTDASGDFSVALIGGNYGLYIGSVYLFDISVPTSGGPYTIGDVSTVTTFTTTQTSILMVAEDGASVRLKVAPVNGVDGADGYAVAIYPV